MLRDANTTQKTRKQSGQPTHKIIYKTLCIPTTAAAETNTIVTNLTDFLFPPVPSRWYWFRPSTQGIPKVFLSLVYFVVSLSNTHAHNTTLGRQTDIMCSLLRNTRSPEPPYRLHASAWRLIKQKNDSMTRRRWRVGAESERRSLRIKRTSHIQVHGRSDIYLQKRLCQQLAQASPPQNPPPSPKRRKLQQDHNSMPLHTRATRAPNAHVE